MPENTLRILLLEDNSIDERRIMYELKKGSFEFVSERVETEQEFLRALKEFKPDVILGDYTLPTFDGLKALDLTLRESPDTPLFL